MKRMLLLSLLFIFYFISHGQVNLNQGLVAYYPFNGNANDVSGNNNNPVFNNAVPAADHSGNPNSAYHFNGLNSYMQILNSPTLNMGTAMSIAMWVKPTGYYTGLCYNNILAIKGDADGLPGLYSLRFGDVYNGCNGSASTSAERFYGTAIIAQSPLVQLNQWYSLVLTTDGITAKLYVNCELQASVPASGSGFSNAYDLYLGHMNNAQYRYWLNGDMDEVRIYNRALNQDEVNTLGECALTGTNIINDYTPVLAFNPCDNKITVADGTAFNAGDTVLMIQMKGAGIDSTNTPAFGTITDYKNAGNYEFNYVKSRSGNIIELKNNLTRQYTIPQGKVQLIRVPYYNSFDVNTTLTCLPWDGNKGGVLVLNAKDTVRLNADINTTAKGFLKGIMHNSNFNAFTCGVTGYYFPDNTVDAAGKGEGITFLSTGKNSGNGPAANGGGGGMNSNSGGAGGGNGSKGGRGGYEWNYGCPNYLTSMNWGYPGFDLNYNSTDNKVFMGGGGGAGHCNDQYDDPTALADYNGGSGGAIVLINANYIQNNNNSKIISKGDSAYQLNVTNSYITHDGMGGGGAGGTVLLNINNYINNIPVDISGGDGSDVVAPVSIAGFVGPGGGGGGGVVWVKQNTLPANLSITNAGGVNGVIVQGGYVPYGAEPGIAGINVFSLSVPVDNVLFKKNIDSVRIQGNPTCLSVAFNGLGYTNTNPVSTWDWYFGDAGTAHTQNTSHTYASAGTFLVKLVITDINGCKDSITKNVTTVACVTSIINDYAAVLALDPCTNKITVDDATKYNVGDTVLLIQMKGAIIDSTNTSSFGTITDYKNAGNYEFNYVKSKSGNTIEIKNKITRQFDLPAGKVQLVRVPYYQNLTTTTILSCKPWNGSTGGVLTFNVANTLDLGNDIDVNGKGFMPGVISNNPDGSCGTGSPDYYYPLTQPGAWNAGGAEKGEGISTVSVAKMAGKGPLGNGGGGGNKHNTGGGGGGNYGKGGNELIGCSVDGNGGLGGTSLTAGYNSNKIFMGGGGGRGDDNDHVGTTGEPGGGIVIISANILKGNNNSINADGNSQLIAGTGIADGAGGGGAGGSILLDVSNYNGNVNLSAKGGKGGDQQATYGCVGTGSGGGAGVIILNTASQPAAIATANTNGGKAGMFLSPGFPCTNTTYGATDGIAGAELFNLQLPVSTVPFKPNIDSARIHEQSTSCFSFDFNGFGYTNTNPIGSWQWYFGDSGSDNVQNTSHTYATAGSFPVQLIITDINGCKDSITKNVITTAVSVDAGRDSVFCGGPVALQLHGTTAPATGSFSWSPAVYLNNSTIPDPTATINATTTFYLTITELSGCKVKDSVTIKVNSASSFVQPPAKSFCLKNGVLLDGANGNSPQYLWSPSTYLSNDSVINPFANPPGSTSYTVKITDTTCHYDSSFTVLVTVKPLPVISAAKSNDIDCAYKDSHLSASGAVQYTWTPASTLSNPSISNPIATPTTNTQYIVTGTDNAGCKNIDTVSVLIKTGADAYAIPNSFTPNGDGYNDCFNIRHWGDAKNVYFIIYNRFGEKVFETNNVNVCWDGTYKGMPADPGNYVFYIRALTNCGKMIKKGNVLLVR